MTRGRWRWLLRQVTRRIWFRAGLFSLLAVATALVGAWASPYISLELSATIGADAVDNILGILASSMLTVTTFSLSTMVSAYSAATSNVTPRANILIMEDSTTQNVLSTFIGSFLFSLVGIIALSTGTYGAQGRVVLFGVTILVIGFILVTLLRWIDHLSRLGRVTETTQRVEEAAIKAIRDRRRRPHLGCRPLRDRANGIPAGARRVAAPALGYVQHIDVEALGLLAAKASARLFVLRLPGEMADTTEAIIAVEGGPVDDAALGGCFTIGDRRSFDQDPRFGICVLTEVASRALSPATNDLGTAVDVIGRLVRVLAAWAEPADADATEIAGVFVPPLRVDDLFDDAFLAIGRDGANVVEVGTRLQKALHTLSRLDHPDFAEAARRHSRLAMRRAELVLQLNDDKRLLEDLAAKI
ncbi:DUF2254 domain-containing protein [Antarcticirhabdus aurantiaca]|uniref:DUF2254 domain-containing protein n=1 Tax=Antarcticirhabdus aurantiaca TaxID=2606717 RepID=A0ACD4NWL4_9HYPH|nr:DUF2254 domain-containing protein [Antarcticirhabdus aurantiaca]WAJ31292.1 DUF2254 domain-containing protein [Jeongeuplla avenae]